MAPGDTTNRGAEGLRCIQLADPYKALGLATNLLSKVAPYRQYRLDKLVPTLMGQIQRKHYAFVTQGGKPVGYSGWARCDPEVAEGWMTGRCVPTMEQCRDGACPVLVTFHSKDRAATWFLIRYMRSLYPGQQIYFSRDYAGGRSRKGSVLNFSAPDGS